MFCFGNIPPTYLFPGVPSDSEHVRVLQLASGDLRSSLCSLARDSPSHTRPVIRRVYFFLNDTEAAVVARNVLLLLLLHKSKLSAEATFEVWFSLRVGSGTYAETIDDIPCRQEKC